MENGAKTRKTPTVKVS